MTENINVPNGNEELIREIKKDFFSLRNGIIAESIKKLYPEGKIIFGLNVPQFMELSKKYPKNMDLGFSLWKDKKCRESRLLSLYIIPLEELDKEIAKSMIRDVESIEEADFLSFRVLRNLPYAQELYKEISSEDQPSESSSYCVSMFKKNLDQLKN